MSAVGVALLISLVVVGLIAIVLWLSFTSKLLNSASVSYTLANYRTVLFDPFTYGVLLNTAEFCAVSLVVSFLFGLPMAWLAERTDLPGKPLLFTAMTVSLLIPGFAVAMGWLFLLDPRIGIINQWLLALGLPRMNIASMPGMGWVQGLSLAPLAFIMSATVFRTMDPALEEAAEISGASFPRVLRRITMPLIFPGTLAAALYVLSIGFTAFDVPAIIGWSNRIYTFSTYLYLQVTPQGGLPHYGLAAALSTFTIVLGFALSLWYVRILRRSQRFAVLTGKGYRPKSRALGRRASLAWLLIALYLLLSLVVPLLLLVWSSLLRYFQLPSTQALHNLSLTYYTGMPWGLLLRGASNTGLLMLLAPTLAVLISLVFSWIVLRSKLRGRMAFDVVAFLPHVVPSIVFSVAGLLVALFVFGNRIPIYGTVWLLLAMFVVVRLSIATRMMNGALIQVHKELDEAAYVNGASSWQTVRRILAPILMPAMLYAWLWIALLTYRELTVATVLSTGSNVTLTVVVWDLWVNGFYGEASAVTICLIALLLPLIGLYWFLARKTGIATQTA